MNQKEISKMIRLNFLERIRLEELLQSDSLNYCEKEIIQEELKQAEIEKEMLYQHKFNLKMNHGFKNYLLKGA